MFSLCSVLFVVSLLQTTFGGVELPPEFVKCGRHDPDLGDCLKTASTKAIEIIKDGYPQFGIDPIDPLVIKNLEIGGENSGNAVNVRQKYTNFRAVGAANIKVKSVRANLLDQCKVLVDALIPTLDFDGNYDLQGKVLLLPISGKGKVIFNMVDVGVRAIIRCEKYTENGENYYRANEFLMDIKPKNMTLNFENLFNDKQLSDNMNKVLNENWQTIFEDAKKDYEMEFAKVFADITNKIFTKVPEDKVFLN